MAGTLYVEIVAPDRNVFRGEATAIRAPGAEGSFQVLHDHAPMLAVIETGPIYVTTPGGEKIAFATSGGFLEVLNNHVIVLAETAEPASGIDVDRARQAEERALELIRMGGPEAETAQRELEIARNRLRMAMGAVGKR